MKDLFVCMGNASTTDTQAFVSHARMAMDPTTSTSGDLSRPKPSVMPILKTPRSDRPESSASTSTIGRDSGLGPSRVGSSMDLDGYASGMLSTEDTMVFSVSFDSSSKPFTPRPNQTVCMVAERSSSRGGMAYIQPPASPLSDDSSDEEDLPNPTANEEVTFKTTDEFGAVIVGTILKHAVAEVTGRDISDVSLEPQIQEAFPHEKFNNLTLDSLDAIISKEKNKSKDTVKEVVPNPKPAQDDTTMSSNSQVSFKEEEPESDNDSVLNSDEDYEGERDSFFRKRKDKTYRLSRQRGIEEFKTFLCATMGERNWNLWLDIERAKLIKDEEELGM